MMKRFLRWIREYFRPVKIVTLPPSSTEVRPDMSTKLQEAKNYLDGRGIKEVKGLYMNGSSPPPPEEDNRRNRSESN